MGRSLLVTGHGLHAKHGAPYPALASEWLRPLVAAAGGRRVDVVYHTVDAPGSRKPDQYVMTQGDARIALVNRGQREQLHGWANTSTFPPTSPSSSRTGLTSRTTPTAAATWGPSTERTTDTWSTRKKRGSSSGHTVTIRAAWPSANPGSRSW